MTDCAALVVFTFCAAKVSEVGDSVGGGVAPVPLSATVPTPATVRVAERAPSAVGLKVTLMVQFAPTGKLVPHVPPADPVGRTNSVPEIEIVDPGFDAGTGANPEPFVLDGNSRNLFF